MGYVENHLNRGEQVVKKADRNGLFLLAAWIKGILLCWLLLIPTIKAIIATVRFKHVELAVTNKRVVGKMGVANTDSLDSPLDKIQNVGVSQKMFGKIFNYGTVEIVTAAKKYDFGSINNAEAFKGMIMSQIDQFSEDKLKQQAQFMAQSMASVINK